MEFLSRFFNRDSRVIDPGSIHAKPGSLTDAELLLQKEGIDTGYLRELGGTGWHGEGYKPNVSRIGIVASDFVETKTKLVHETGARLFATKSAGRSKDNRFEYASMYACNPVAPGELTGKLTGELAKIAKEGPLTSHPERPDTVPCPSCVARKSCKNPLA